MQLSLFQWLLVGATVSLQVAILTVLAKKKSRRDFPWFFNFLAFSLVTFVVQSALVSRASSNSYFYFYWTISAVATILSFAVSAEVFVHILKPYSALMDLGKLLFRWALLFLAVASSLMALTSSGSGNDKICAAIELFTRSTQLMQCGLLLLLVLFESRLGLSWRSPAVCIMFGFGFNATLAFVTAFLQDRLPSWNQQLSMIAPVACVVIYAGWFASLMLPQPQRRTAQDSPTRIILQRWNEALLATPLVARNNQAALPVESFLPGVERAVERVMARKMAN